jgi:dTDP-4-amino-4,6-dideoxygalactose transaminase
MPVHLQTPYASTVSLPHTEQLAKDVLSLPLYPELGEDSVDYVSGLLRAHGA